MRPHTIPQTVLFPDLFDKPLVATFNQEHASSDGGAVLLKATERVYGLVKAFARCLADKRAAEKIRHTFADLIGQRIFGIACGHPDGNDADHLADDPIHKLLLGRDPVSGAPLASQPTISRFENGASRTALYRMGRENAVLERHAESAMQTARTQSEVSGETAHVYTDTRYAARIWGHERRVVIKAEVVRLGERAPRDNPRFVVTNLRQTPRFIYEKVYCARGDIENRIKELLDGLQIDRTSCCRFWANQLRVLLTAAAYVLMQELRLRAAGTACARTQVTWLRDRLLKLGVQVVRSVRRLVLHLPLKGPRRSARHGSASPSHSAHVPDSPSVPPHQAPSGTIRTVSRRSCRHSGSPRPAIAPWLAPQPPRSPQMTMAKPCSSSRHALSIPNIELQ